MAGQHLPRRRVRRAVPALLLVLGDQPGWGRRYSAAAGDPRLPRRTAPTRGCWPWCAPPARCDGGDLDESAGTWRVTTTDGTTYDADMVVSAVGQLSNPVVPDLPGAESFAGPAFHSAQWRHDVELAGKRVAVIGTGASAIQFVPGIVDEVGAMTVFQRSAPYVVPKPDQGYKPHHHRAFAPLPLAAARRAALRVLADRADERRDHRRDAGSRAAAGDDPGVVAAAAAPPGPGPGAAPQAGAGLPDRLQAGAVLQRLVPRARPRPRRRGHDGDRRDRADRGRAPPTAGCTRPTY